MTVFPLRRRRKGGALNLDLCTNTFPVTGSYVCDSFSQVCFLSNTLPPAGKSQYCIHWKGAQG